MCVRARWATFLVLRYRRRISDLPVSLFLMVERVRVIDAIIPYFVNTSKLQNTGGGDKIKNFCPHN